MTFQSADTRRSRSGHGDDIPLPHHACMTPLRDLLAKLGNDGAVENARLAIEARLEAERAVDQLERSLAALEPAVRTAA